MYVEIDIETHVEKTDNVAISAGKRITEQRIGTGRRRVVVVSEGDKWVVLYNPFSCEHVRIPVDLYDRWDSRTLEVTPRLVAIATDNIAMHQRVGIDDGGNIGQRALKVLQG